MARTDSLTNFLTDIATAIKNKKGDTTPIPASNFDSEINNLQTGGGDVEEYFNTTITSNTSSNKVFGNNFIKKAPDVTVDDTVTSLSYAFYQVKGALPKVICNNNVTSISYMYASTTATEVDLSGINTENLTNASNTFFSSKFIELDLSSWDLKNLTSANYMFSGCPVTTLKINGLDLGKVTSFNATFRMFKGTDLSEIDASSSVNMENVLYIASNLTNFGGFKNLGQAYLTTSSANNSLYKLDLSASTQLTHDSLMNVINNLYDIKTKGCATQQLVLGSTNLAKLTEDEIAIATNKGWTVS